jgi:hypothetical protein
MIDDVRYLIVIPQLMDEAVNVSIRLSRLDHG